MIEERKQKYQIDFLMEENIILSQLISWLVLTKNNDLYVNYNLFGMSFDCFILKRN